MKVCIVGGGATGLTAGYELCKMGHAVTVYEGEERTGGLAGAFTAGSRRLDRFYHHIFTSDTYLIGLIDELGLSGNLKWLSPSDGIYMDGKLYPFTTPGDLLRFKELPFIRRLFLGFLVYRSKFVNGWERLENVSAREWVERNAGRAAYEKVWGPLMNSKFDFDAESISAVWLWNKFKLRGSSRAKSLGGELLGYMDGSFELIYEKAAEYIRNSGGKVLCSSSATNITQMADRTLKVVSEKEEDIFDRVVVTTAPQTLADLGLTFPEDYAVRLGKIKYKSNICMVLELEAKLSPYYWITIAEEDFPFVLLIEHTNLVGTDGYGSHIVYLSRYLDEESELYSATDSQVRECFFNYLKKIFPEWDETLVIKTHIHRARFAQPVVFKGYSQVKPGFETPVENLYLATMAQIYPEDRGQNYSVRMGKQIAAYIAEGGVRDA